jgi:uncharacterized protein YndB with AHSA1/START domain
MIDVIAQLSDVQRKVGARSPGAGSTHSVTISQVYDAAIDDVWDACTNPERIARWFLPVTGDLQPGGRYQLEGNAGGSIERCDPPRSFAATWEYGDTVTSIELRLGPEADGRTRLELEHVVPADDQQWQRFGPGAFGVGWDLVLLGLGLHLSAGSAAGHPADAAWPASADGRRFMAMSSERWGDADVAAGTSATDARTAASRTRGFYLGAEAPAS